MLWLLYGTESLEELLYKRHCPVVFLTCIVLLYLTFTLLNNFSLDQCFLVNPKEGGGGGGNLVSKTGGRGGANTTCPPKWNSARPILCRAHYPSWHYYLHPVLFLLSFHLLPLPFTLFFSGKKAIRQCSVWDIPDHTGGDQRELLWQNSPWTE